MQKILLSLVIIFALGTMVVGATRAYYSDTETSTGNMFTSGTLDLNLDGGNTNVVKFSVTDMKPTDTKVGTWTVHNAGSIPGYLDIHNITQTHGPGITTEAESAIENPDIGTLGALLTAQLFVDTNNNQLFDVGDTLIYSGNLGGMSADYDQNLALAAGGTNYITLVVNWPSSANDSKGQGDTAQLDMAFQLGQDASQ